MDAKDPAAPTLAARSVQELISLTTQLADELELRTRECLYLAPHRARLYGKSLLALLEHRAYLRQLDTQLVPLPPAAPVPDPQHGAATPGAARTPSTTAGAAGVFQRQCMYTTFGLDGSVAFRCTRAAGHDGLCGELEAGTTPPAPRSASAADGAARAESAGGEGGGEADHRTNGSRGGRGDLAEHLAMLKGGRS